MATVAILARDVQSLIICSTFANWIFYVVAMILLLLLRKIRPNAKRPFKVGPIAATMYNI